ncbi:MAG: hypothetical protein E6G59_07515 [Actinobacteria bacterium]|nr:MAG: hypothetical protein E6G59_07515 [Actinomycetota bacterium]
MKACLLSYKDPPAGERMYAVSVRLHGAFLQNRKLLMTRLTTGGRRRIEAPAGAIKASGTIAASTSAIPRMRIVRDYVRCDRWDSFLGGLAPYRPQPERSFRWKCETFEILVPIVGVGISGRIMRANAEHRGPGLALRFAGASLVVFLAVGVAAHAVVRRQVQADDQNNAQFHAVFVTDSLLVPIFHGIDLQKPVTGMVAVGIRARLAPVFGARIKRLKVWRPDGTIVFSDEPRLIGKRFDAADDFAATKDGPHSEITDLTDPENAFERGLAPTMFSTYLRLPSAPQLMVELYQDYGPTQAAIDHTVVQLDLALVSALLLLYLLVLPIAARASRRLRASNDALRVSNEELRAGKGQLRESLEREHAAAERLRSLDDMKNMILTSVSHELRTPLTSIIGFASTLQRRHAELNPATQQEIANRIQRVVAHADIRDRTVVVSADPVQVNIDPSKLERILENLLSNEARHTPPGTHITVRAGLIDEGVLLQVEDNGPGIQPEARDRIFQPFAHGRQQSPHAPGAGVGLALVAGFAELHGGRAWVEESESGGARFKVLIPAEPPHETYVWAAS